jgi:hypothetical protein
MTRRGSGRLCRTWLRQAISPPPRTAPKSAASSPGVW